MSGSFEIEDLIVLGDPHCPLLGYLLEGEDGLYWAGVDAKTTVDAFFRVDVERFPFVVVIDAIDRAHINTGLVLNANARFRDDMSHAVAPLVLRARPSAVLLRSIIQTVAGVSSLNPVT